MNKVEHHPDYIVLRSAPDIEIGDMAGERLDLRTSPLINVALGVYGCRLVPTPELEYGVDGSVAQVFMVEKDK